MVIAWVPRASDRAPVEYICVSGSGQLHWSATISSSTAQGTDKIIALRADDPLFWLERGRYLLLAERPTDAGRCFDQALDAAPRDPVALNARARTHLSLGELDQALVLLEHACSLDDGVAELWNNRGVAQARAGDLEGAMASFERALVLDPHDASVLCNRAMALVGDGRHHQALDDLASSVQCDPDCITAWSVKGATHLRLGQLRMARHAFLQASSLAWSHGAPKRHGAAMTALAGAIGLVNRARGED